MNETWELAYEKLAMTIKQEKMLNNNELIILLQNLMRLFTEIRNDNLINRLNCYFGHACLSLKKEKSIRFIYICAVEDKKYKIYSVLEPFNDSLYLSILELENVLNFLHDQYNYVFDV